MADAWAFSELAPAERTALQAAAAALAKRPDTARTEDLEVLALQSRGQAFAVPLQAVLSVTELHSLAFVPRAPPAVRGLVSVRGEVMIAVELAGLTGAGEVGLKDLKRVVVLGIGSRRLGVLAERILAVRATSVSAFKAASHSMVPFVTGLDDELTSLIDPKALIAQAFSLLEGPA
jgi:purine-binding chemotaxis protein CheW